MEREHPIWCKRVILLHPSRKSRCDSRLDLRSHLDWWAKMRLIELSHKSAARFSEAEKELKFGSVRYELAHNRSGSRRRRYEGLRRTLCEGLQCCGASELFDLSRPPHPVVISRYGDIKCPEYTRADGRIHWRPAPDTSNDWLFVSSLTLHFYSSCASASNF